MSALDDYMAEARRAPFGYDGARGEIDCCTFPAGAALAQTGRDPAAPYRGRYRTEAEALALFPARGLAGILDGAFVACGFRRTYPLHDGDCACVRVLGDGPDVGTVAGAVRHRGAWWLKTPTGLARFADNQIQTVVAWRVN